MRQFIAIAGNAFMELIRQPIFLLLMTVSALFEVGLACVNYFGFGDEPKLVKNSALAVMLLAGLFSAVTSASASLAREIRSGTALAVLAKPVSRAQFLLAKYVGLALSLLVLTYVNCVAALLATRMAFDAYGDIDYPGLLIFAGSIALAYLIGGVTNYFLRRSFVSDAALALVVMVTLAFGVLEFIPRAAMRAFNEFAGMDWRVVPASGLILMALLILAALALACSTRLELIPTLCICSALFLLGLVSDYFFGKPAAQGHLWASVLYTVTPNWQLFWVADLLEGTKPIPASYLAKAGGYAAGYVGAVLALGLALFEDRELS
ncbi:MAG: ABC transporter permease subunit [Verrucomicrobiota bacterium]|jgi:ABC-type transport system involved in multi-copper enzyme maturation permease subunit